MKRINIGVVIYTKIGTKTSILLGEFEFWNHFYEVNPDCDFYFISISKNTTKSILDNAHLLKFPVRMIQVYSKEDLHKLDGLSGVFTYMNRNTFFGGQMNPSCVHNYMISAYCSNNLNLPLFIRTPDSEYPYLDYKRIADVRIEKATPSTPKFIRENQRFLDIIPTDIKYENVYFVANGSSQIYDWVVDVVYNDIPDHQRMMTLKEISDRTIYVSDDLLHNISLYRNRYEYLGNRAEIDRILFIGYLQGSVAAGRIKVLNKMFGSKVEDIPLDIYGPGASELEINRSDINLINQPIFGTAFFELLNKHLGYVFIGKGNPVNKYINKTVYDCMSAKCPVIVYAPCDTNGLLFTNREFYFTTESELLEIVEKLKNPTIRERWIIEQKTELLNTLNTKMDPMFYYREYCEPKEQIVNSIRTSPLF